MTPHEWQDELLTLASALCEGIATNDQVTQLEARVLTNDAACTTYLDYLSLHGSLCLNGQDRETRVQIAGSPEAGLNLGPVVRSPVLGFLSRATTTLNRPVVWSILAVAVVFYGTFTVFSWNLRPSTVPIESANNEILVAMVNSSSEVRWSKESTAKSSDSTIRQGDPLVIDSGVLQLTLGRGTKLSVEGPAQWTIDDDNAVTLVRGKLVARVPTKAIGFRVTTLSATVIDLGTEFSVEADKQGATNVQVLQGTVEVGQVKPPVSGNVANSVRLIAGQSLRVNATESSTIVDSRKALPTGSQAKKGIADLDLADIVAGGDGLGHRRGFGIDPTNGRLLLTPDTDYSRVRYFPGDGKYHRVEDRPFIDGVSIPDPSKGPVQLTSVGQTFGGFPQTNNLTFAPVWAGALPPALGDELIRTTFDGGLDFAVSPHSVIVFHPNKLITFDLEAIRRVHAKQIPSALHAIIGLTKPMDGADRAGSADFWVFVDGEVQFSRRAISSDDAPQEVDVPLSSSAHFLTIASTDAGDDFNWDWLILGDPRLTLAPAGKTATFSSPLDSQAK